MRNFHIPPGVYETHSGRQVSVYYPRSVKKRHTYHNIALYYDSCIYCYCYCYFYLVESFHTIQELSEVFTYNYKANVASKTLSC